MKVQNMKSNSGNSIANQFEIFDGNGKWFQSYNSIIAFKPYGDDPVLLDINDWDYSVTTGKYRNQFLGEDIKTTREKIKSGEYQLVNLNV